MKSKAIILILLLIVEANFLVAQQLRVFSELPGRTPSTEYKCRVRQVGSTVWQDAFVLQTKSIPKVSYTDGTHNGYVDILRNWTASWIAFEFAGVHVEVEISKVSGAAITKAKVRPVGAASDAIIVDGKAYVTFNKNANINVDINGQMEDTYTGMGYSGPPVHTICLYGNPIYKVPNLANPRVKAINPGETLPVSLAQWDTIYFKPGIHRVGTPYVISSNKTMYIPGNAVVHGTIQPPNAWGSSAAKNWCIYGSGTISGEEIARNTATKDNKHFTYQASSVRLEGFVIIDPAHHTYNMGNTSSDPAEVNIYNNLKILAWRVNSDGINAFSNSTITNCFFRCQDDIFYYGEDNVKISDIVCWNDFNGAVLFVTKGSSSLESSYFKDIKVIYHRAYWHYWTGGRVISFRDREPGNVINNVQIKNVLVEDPLPAFAPFYMKMVNPNNSTARYDYQNINIENVIQNAKAVVGSQDNTYGPSKNTMLGLDATRKFENIVFYNCFYNGKWINSFTDGDFLKNNFVANIYFFTDHVNSVTNVDKKIKVFVNPATKKLTINMDGEFMQQVQLVDLTGKIVLTKNVSTTQVEIDLSGFASGLYIVKVFTSNLYTAKVNI